MNKICRADHKRERERERERDSVEHKIIAW